MAWMTVKVPCQRECRASYASAGLEGQSGRVVAVSTSHQEGHQKGGPSTQIMQAAVGWGW